jgi:tetratricopeptide (TPR) repeat protein
LGSAACPSDNTLGAFVDGRLSPEAFAEVERHLDACSSCREVISVLAATRSPKPGSEPLPPGEDGEPDLGMDARIGRFVIMGVLGRGGMGVVYRAHDPALERDVALKLLRTDGPLGPGDEAASARLSREAKALAQVRHANVIAVHDVDTFEGRVFFTMELVEGAPLSIYVSQRDRSAAEVIAAFVKAGLGLHAAHEAGLVHRDFKPDNVLVGGDGRILVTDFGLACAEGGPGPEAAGPDRLRFASGTLTRSGAVLGTPAYMAPEQRQGGPVSARSDQFSFCVALWEALAGALPFATLDDRLAGRVAEPTGSARRRLSARVRRVLSRGLRADPAERYPSMLALLHDLSPPRRRWEPALAALLVVAVGVAALSFARRPDPCAEARTGLPGVWDAARKQAVTAALLASGKPYAADASREVGGVLDAYAARWSAQRRDACEATHVRHEQSGDLLDRRMRCLDSRRAALSALVTLLEKGGDIVPRAAGAAHDLEGLASCADAGALLARVAPPREAPARAAAEAIDRDLGVVRAELDLGKSADARRRLDAILAEARSLGHGPTLARALWLAGLVQAASIDPLAAEASLREAAHVADASGDDETRARAWMELTRLLGFRTERVSDGLAAAEEARAALTRLGGSDELEGKRLDGLGIVLHAAGRDADAAVEMRRSLALRERALGPDAREVGESLSHLGSVLLGAGAEADREAVSLLERSLGITERVYGPQHPATTAGRFNLARAVLLTGHFEEAVTESRRVEAQMLATLGPDHPSTGYAISNLGQALAGAGRHEEAVTELRRSLAILERALGPKHREAGEVYVRAGLSLLRLRRLEEATASIQKGLAVLSDILPPTHPLLALPLRAQAELALAGGRPRDALPLLQRALAVAEKEGPATRAEIRCVLVRALSAAGRRDEAAAAAAVVSAEIDAAGDAAAPTRAALAAWKAEVR